MNIIGPRILKTGLAVIITLLLSQLFNLPHQFLAVVGAIVSMKTSVAQSVIQGGYQIAGTIIGGIVGLALLFIFGSNPFIVGIAIIIAIVVCIQLKMQEAVVLSGVVVAAVMVGVEGDSLIYASERLLVTSLGIIVGVTVNVLLFPPKCEKHLRVEIEKLNYMLKKFYVLIADGFLKFTDYDEAQVEKKADELRAQYEEVRKKLFEFKQEVGYLRSKKKMQKYEKIVTRLYFIFERIMGIYQTVYNRNARLKKSEHTHYSPQYKEILADCRNLFDVTLKMHDSLTNYYIGNDYKDDIETKGFTQGFSVKGDKLTCTLREKICKWHLIDENRENSFSLMEISNIGYEMEQIYCYLKDISGLYRDLKAL